MLTIRAMSSGRGYAANHLVHSDYYAEAQRVVGYWHGRGAAELGLTGEVRDAEFEAIRQGLHPTNGESLRPRQSVDRLSADGAVQSRGRHLYDFTISAPKSVSILAAVGGDERLVDAHQRAVDDALTELETAAAARIRIGGANDSRLTGNLVLAVYHHDTSRELDPQLHTHAVAGNLTYDGAEGRWKALQASDIYTQRAYLTEVYRNALAREVRALGYAIEDRRDGRGRDHGFEIGGVSEEVLRRYSQRSQQRDEAIAAFTSRTGRQPTDNEVAVLVRESRADKLIAISPGEVRDRQLRRVTADEAHTLTELRRQALERAQSGIHLDHDPPARALQYAEAHHFERRSVAQAHELLTEALRHGRGWVAVEEVKGQLRLEEAAGAILRVGNHVATRESLDRERAMIAAIDRGIGAYDRLGGNHLFVASDRLRLEQQHAIHAVLASRDWAVNVRGAAGTGKTALLQDLHRGLTEAGREALAVAPTTSAVHELQRVGFAEAITIQRLLVDRDQQQRLRDQVLIVDEAGMVSAQQMTSLLALAEQQGARVVFSGDTRQMHSVEAGDALRILERDSALRSVSLTEVQRQTPTAYRAAIEDLREAPGRGFRELEAMGVVREVPWSDRAQAVAEAWREAHAHVRGEGRDGNVLVVCATHDEIGRVTAAIRADREQAGELGATTSRERYVPLHYTLAQKTDPRQFHEGQVLVFHQASAGIDRQAALEIVRVEPDRLVVQDPAGARHVVGSDQAAAFSVYERRPMAVAPQDRLLLSRNYRDEGFHATNGELVTVSRVHPDGRLDLDDGRTIPSTYKHLDYGYAVTAHRSQGQSVEAVIIAGDRMSRELFYVAASRGRESLTVITSDKGRLAESVTQSEARASALELVRRMSQARPMDDGVRTPVRGFERGIRAVVEQVQRAAAEDHGNPGGKRAEAGLHQAIQSGGHSNGGAGQQLERGDDFGFTR
jgi:conjugative relaxase-like TrwC/TraI family protein